MPQGEGSAPQDRARKGHWGQKKECTGRMYAPTKGGEEPLGMTEFVCSVREYAHMSKECVGKCMHPQRGEPLRMTEFIV